VTGVAVAILAAACWAATETAPAAPAARAARPAIAPAQPDQAAAAKQPKKTKKAKKDKKPRGQKKAKNAKPATNASGASPSDADREVPPSPDEPLAEDTVDATAATAPGARLRAVWKQHPSIRYGKIVRLDFALKIQEDWRSSYDGSETDLDAWELHRSRVGVQGTVLKHIEFEIERELKEKELSDKDVALGLTPAPAWKDVYVNLDYFPDAQIRAGKFKVPFGLDTLTGVSHNDFIYRSLGAIYLTPSRDVGVMLHGRFFKRGLNYWTGVFRHDGDNARSKKILGGDRTFAARITGAPLRSLSPERLGAFDVGASFAITRLSDDSFRPNGLRGRTVVTQDTFFEPVYVKGTRGRWAADVDWTIGRASARSEYTHVRDTRRQQGFGDETLPDARYRAWYASATWLLTGEAKTRPVKPAVDIQSRGTGAVEAAIRFDRLWFDSVDRSDEPFANPRAFNILPVADGVWTAGVNWTLNRFVKLQFNVIREHVDDPDRNPVAEGAAFWSRVVRLQLVL
jgi:phosphate-selective porin